jgi:hypothetical protein
MINEKDIQNLILDYSFEIEINNQKVRCFIDEVKLNKNSELTTLIFIGKDEYPTLNTDDIFTINNIDWEIKEYVSHYKTHYEILLGTKVDDVTLPTLYIYINTITYNNCRYAKDSEILYTFNVYDLKTTSKIPDITKIGDEITHIITIEYKDNIKMGMICKVNNNYIKIEKVENVNEANNEIKLYCSIIEEGINAI